MSIYPQHNIPAAAKALLHSQLLRNSFYQLSPHYLNQIIELLNYPANITSQESLFQGIFTILNAMNSGLFLNSYLSQPYFTHISMASKQIFYKILNQMHYLLNLKAYELYFPNSFVYNVDLNLKTESTPPQRKPPKPQPRQRPITGPYFISLGIQETSDRIKLNEFIKIKQQKVQCFRNLDFANIHLLSQKHKSIVRRRTSITTQDYPLNPVLSYLTLFYLRSFYPSLSDKSNQQTNKCVCLGHSLSPDTYSCPLCQRIYHKSCLEYCPFCYLSTYDPSLKPIKVLNNTFHYRRDQQIICFDEDQPLEWNSVVQECRDNNRMLMISCQRVFENTSFRTHPTHFKRVCKREDVCWPDNATLCLNFQPLCKFQPLSKESRRKVRQDRPLILDVDTLALRLKHAQKVTLHFTLSDDDKKEVLKKAIYAVSVIECVRRNKQQIVEYMLDNRGMALLDADANYHSSSKEVPDQMPLDPYTRQIIEISAKGVDCRHTECFDLETYIILQKHFKLWKCPICNKYAKKVTINMTKEQIMKTSHIKLSTLYRIF